MTFETLKYKTSGRIGLITFNRPDRMNAFNVRLCAELKDAVKKVDADPAIRVVLIRGAGRKAFSAGYDIAESAAAPKRGITEWRAKLAEDLEFTMAPWNCSKPVIAVIYGHCLGGGLEFAQMCDLRLASTESKYGVVVTRFAAGVATSIMPWIIGSHARRLIYTGDIIDAEEAVRIGLVDKIYPTDNLEEEAMKIAGRMGQVASEALQWNKRVINRTYEIMGLSSALRYGLEACTILDSTETEEGRSFDQLRRTQGLQEALAWRRELFKPYE